MSRERDRYGRKSLAEQVGDVIGWFRAHPLALIPIALVVAGIVIQAIAPPRSARPNDLVVGDCLFVRTAAANVIGPEARPIGEPEDVASVLMRGGAELASCSASHGHEVSGVFAVSRQSEPEQQGFGKGWASACQSATKQYLGHTAIDSIYIVLTVKPTEEAWALGVHRVICLLARADGQWMTAPARGSSQ